MRYIRGQILFLLLAIADGAWSQDLCLLAVRSPNELTQTVEVLEMSGERVLRCPKADNQSFSVVAAIKRAQDLLKADKNSRLDIGEHWYSPVKSSVANNVKDPFGRSDGLLVCDLEWNLMEAVVREVDLGRSKSSPHQWRANLSQRFWVEVKLMGMSPDRGSVGLYVSVFLFQDMSLLVPQTYSLDKVKINPRANQ